MGEREMSDSELARKCRQGDTAAWRRLVHQFSPLVYRVALRMLKNQSEAEDAAQEVFVKIHHSLHTFDATRPLSPWISRITYNHCLRRLGNPALSKQVAMSSDELLPFMADGAADPERLVSHKQTSYLVNDALQQLPAIDRTLLGLRYAEGFTDSELAQATDMPVGTVKTRMHRARSKLKQVLAPLFGERS